MILVNTDYISGKEFEMLGLVKGSTIQSKHLGKDIAQAGGGMYIHVDQTNMAQAILEQEIGKMQKEDISASMYSDAN